MITSTSKHRDSILRFVEYVRVAVVLASAVFATQSAQAQSYHVIHTFTGGADGANPLAGLALDASGNRYGTTSVGGAFNLGTVFKVDPTGAETVLHSFAGGTDGANPYAPLVLDSSGNLYGTTILGGASNSGTVFKVDTTGTETVLLSFAGGADGKIPYAPLVLDSSGNLYGTTTFGGASNSGTVFKLDTTGTETVLYSFTGGADGGDPTGSLIRDAAGNLFGTTNGGGKPNACFLGYVGCGVVFKLDTAGTETVLYTFTGGADGGNAYFAGLVRDAGGNLYGTTAAGGTTDNGVAFKLDTTGTETVLYSFGNGGVAPLAGLILDAAGNLYGTTSNGGSGFGTVFKLNGAGQQTVLHQFAGGADGATPYSTLALDSAGNLYGTTSAGGTSTFGTVFEITAATADFSLSAIQLAPSTVSRGGSSTATVNIAAIAAFSGSISLSCSVHPSPAMAPKCSISPGSIPPGTAAILTVSTTGPGAAVVPFGRGYGLFYALCLPLIGLVTTRVGRDSDQKGRTGNLTSAALTCMLLAGLMFQVACGGGSAGSGSGGGSKGTPAGAYTITVTGTDATGSLVHTTPTVLTVQ